MDILSGTREILNCHRAMLLILDTDRRGCVLIASSGGGSISDESQWGPASELGPVVVRASARSADYVNVQQSKLTEGEGS